jgi:hypothetical protein
MLTRLTSWTLPLAGIALLNVCAVLTAILGLMTAPAYAQQAGHEGHAAPVPPGAIEWTSLGVLAGTAPGGPGGPEILDGSQSGGAAVTTRRLGQGSVRIPPGAALKLAGRVAVQGQQGGILITNTPPSGDPRSRRIFFQLVSGGREWRIGYRGAGSEATVPLLTLPGGEHGPFELMLAADGRYGVLIFSDGTGGTFDLGEDFHAGAGDRLVVPLIYGTLTTNVQIPQLELFTGIEPGAAGAMAETHGHGEVAVSAAELLAAAKLVSDVRASASRFEDIGVALAEGYAQSTPGVSGFPHFHNPVYASDGRLLDPARPESLVYYRSPAGGMRLVGVMFLAPAGQKGPQIGGPLTVWHNHEDLCYDGPRVAARASNGACPAGMTYRAETVEMLHVWLVDNPGGVFAHEMEPVAMVPSLSGR